MKKPILIISIVLGAAALIWGGLFYWHNLRGAGPAILGPPENIARQIPAKPPLADVKPPASDPVQIPLKLPQGFTISIFSSHEPGARVLVEDPQDTLLVSLTREGRGAVLPDKNGDGEAGKVVAGLRGLDNPQGLAFGPEDPRGSRWPIPER
jgi:hypothetical protein